MNNLTKEKILWGVTIICFLFAAYFCIVWNTDAIFISVVLGLSAFFLSTRFAAKERILSYDERMTELQSDHETHKIKKSDSLEND